MQMSKFLVVLIPRHVFRQESYSYERHYRVLKHVTVTHMQVWVGVA